MASRACASAAAVTVQVFNTTKSAQSLWAARTQPCSRNCRSMAAPSACVARQPNCSTVKVVMTGRNSNLYLTTEPTKSAGFRRCSLYGGKATLYNFFTTYVTHPTDSHLVDRSKTYHRHSCIQREGNNF